MSYCDSCHSHITETKAVVDGKEIPLLAITKFIGQLTPEQLEYIYKNARDGKEVCQLCIAQPTAEL